MTTTRPDGTPPGMDSPAEELLLKAGRHFRKGQVSADLRTLHQIGGREADAFYRDRWSHDKVVRSTHGVNCTGSCSWKVYVKDGIITWEAQQTDYPSVGPDRPEYEPRGCPRGAAFSWYTYSPTRIRYPYVRGVLSGRVVVTRSLQSSQVVGSRTGTRRPTGRPRQRGRAGRRRTTRCSCRPSP